MVFIFLAIVDFPPIKCINKILFIYQYRLMDIRLPVSYYSNFPIKCKCKNACFRYFITNNIAFAPLFSAFRERFRIVEFAHSLFQVPILLPAQRYPYKRKAENGTARRFRFPPAMPFLSIFSGGNEAHIGWSTRFRRIRGTRSRHW